MKALVGVLVEERHSWVALWKYSVHIVVGVLSFGLLALPVVALNLLVQHLAASGVDRLPIFVLMAAECTLALADILLFFRFVYITFVRAWKEFK